MTPAEKLERSRLAIIDYLAKGERGQQRTSRETRAERSEREERSEQADEPFEAAQEEEAAGFFSRNPWLAGVSGAARTWWRHHPAQMAVEMATPALRSYMRRRPFQVLALSAGVGALIVVTRPWRLISLTTLVVAVVKSSQLSGVVMSALSDAQGWQEQRRGREPEL
jgi:hypothetical protein